MTRHLATAALMLLASAVPTQAHALPPGTRVEVFTTSDLPVRHIPSIEGVEIAVWRLDGIVQAQAVLSRGLPADARRAARIAGERLQRRRDHLAPRMMEAARGLAHALLDDGIDRYPAIVFHVPGQKTSVIYGMRDVSAAVAIHENAMGE